MEAVRTTTQELLIEKIRTRAAKVGGIGLGYVGLPLAVEFANVGFSITGIDVQPSKLVETPPAAFPPHKSCSPPIRDTWLG